MERSSSIDLSSAPNSDSEPPPSFHRPPNSSTPQYSADAYRNTTPNSLIQPGGPAAAPATLQTRQDSAPVKKQPRKKAVKDPSAPKPEKPPRKPRAAPGTGAGSRKKAKTEDVDNKPPPAQIAPPASNLQQSRLVEPLSYHQPPAPPPRSDEAAKYSQNGFLNMKQEPVHPPPYVHNQYASHSPPQPQPAPPRTSAIFDPVRSITTQRPPDPPPQSSLTPYSTHTPPRPISRPGASPISSIIDPPAPSLPSAPSPLRTFTTPAETYIPPTHQSTFQPSQPAPPASGPMEIDVPNDQAARKPSITKKPSSEAPTRATSPKPTRAKEQPPPVPMGSGLLSASMFGGELTAEASQDAAAKGPNIVLHIPLKGQRNTVINFARMAEEKYGFAALYPRQAAQRERMARIAAAGAALERSASGSKFGGTSAEGSGEDDVSVDIGGDSENDGDVAMSGINGNADQAPSGTDGPEPKRKRRKKVEDYDEEDPFIDNSEQIWEMQAAASKDGFFVYRGPLVPEGEKPTVERADGTVKRGRGRGRGGGPGSRGGRGARSAAAASGDGTTTSRGGGPGSRGGTTTRKPRMKKAERLAFEQSKQAQMEQSQVTETAKKEIVLPTGVVIPAT